jgi:hypothetical protein
VEFRLHKRPQEPFDHHPGNAVGDRGNPQWPRLAIVLRRINP